MEKLYLFVVGDRLYNLNSTTVIFHIHWINCSILAPSLCEWVCSISYTILLKNQFRKVVYISSRYTFTWIQNKIIWHDLLWIPSSIQAPITISLQENYIGTYRTNIQLLRSDSYQVLCILHFKQKKYVFLELKIM